MSVRVLIAGGGTGGHLFPGIALAQEIKRRDASARVLFVGTARGIEVRAVPKAGFELALLPVVGLRRKGLKGLLRGLLQLPMSLVRAIQLVRREKPDVAVSVGGYAAGPAVLAARLCGVPCMVMEQNAIPGFTNKVLGRLARHVVVALPAQGFSAKKVRLLGNPVRDTLVAVREQPYAPQKPLRLLVFGGSLGARAINSNMVVAAKELQNFDPPIRIVHQTGEADVARVSEAYREAGVMDAQVLPFIDDMAAAYRDADLVLCRAGATTIAELTVCGRPSVLIPFPFAVDDHQTANAKELEQKGAALHIAERDLTPDMLAETLKTLAKDPARLSQMAESARALGRPQAAKDIADVLWKEARHVS